jgi:hypothetical protein
LFRQRKIFEQKMDMQRTSTKSDKVEQLQLLPQRVSAKAPDLAYLMSLPNLRRVVRYSMSLADLEPKQVYEPLGKDKATWSRIEGGDMGFPADLIVPFQSITNNSAPVLWLAHQDGWDVTTMRKRQDDKDKRIADLEARLEQVEHENAVIAKFVKETLR